MARRAVSAVVSADRVDATRVLLWLYAVFVVAAGARSVVQLGLHASRAPVAYALSALAAVMYAVGLGTLRRAASGARPRPARVSAVVELLGVVTIGTLSVVHPSTFPEPTVWSHYGAGYLWIPLLLPGATLLRLRSLPAWTGR